MKKNLTKILAAGLVLSLAFCMAIPSFAAEITSNGGNGSTPVYLSSTDDGTLDGNPAATALSVTVPTALPMAVGTDGTVTTADNCRITNNSFGAVRVKTATINGENGWTLTAFGAMTVGEGSQVATDASDANSQTLISATMAGCYMTGVGDTANNSVAVNYDAIVTPLSVAATEATIASVVFIVEWDTAA